MAGGKVDAGELLVRALDQVVGGIALARYAASQTNDDRLRGVFTRLVDAGEQQERMLRRHLTGYPGPLDRGGGGGALKTALSVGVSAVALAAGFAGAAYVYRLLRPSGAAPED
ncbi:MAG TPA: hypothetical protein VFX49_22720 [Chloroflexota bacterium]|nr:hypothetical protein [Chloroflexota bacterium]